MKRLIAILALVVVPRFAMAQALSDSEIDAAIKAGQVKNGAKDLNADCKAAPGFGESLGGTLAGGVQPIGTFLVLFSSTAGQIASLSADSKRLYLPYAASNVGPELHNRAIFVIAKPYSPSSTNGTIEVASPIERIVLKSKTNRDAVVQPELFSTEPVEWSNLLGGKITGNWASARVQASGCP
jgi:hypothetical protein